MSLVRTIARPMLAGMFVYGGIDAVLHPEPKEPAAEPVGPAVAKRAGLTTDPEQLVRINGAVQVIAGMGLAMGKLPRLSALALAGSVVPTTLAGHRFWEMDDPKDRRQQLIHFLKNLSMLGGLLIAAVDTGGRPSVTWTARQAATRASGAVGEKAAALRSGDS